MRINVDFQYYDSGDPKTLIVLDTSEWAHIKDKPSIIEIVLPGFDKPVVNYFEQGMVNVFNSNILGLSCNGCNNELTDLPDGIYEITLKGSPDTFNKTRYVLRTTQTQLDLDKLFLNLSDSCSGEVEKSKFSTLQEIQMLLKSAEANTRYENICTAQNLLLMAQQKIKEQNCNKC